MDGVELILKSTHKLGSMGERGVWGQPRDKSLNGKASNRCANWQLIRHKKSRKNTKLNEFLPMSARAQANFSLNRRERRSKRERVSAAQR